MTGQQLTSIGVSLMMIGVALVALGSHFLEEPTFVAGFLMGFASVLMGTSIVFNCKGLLRIRAERTKR
jgi:hypothetical protein